MGDVPRVEWAPDAGSADFVDMFDWPWSCLTDVQREAMVFMVREGLRRLSDTVEEWLPSEALLRRDSKIGLLVSWQNRHLDETVTTLLMKAQRDRAALLDDMRRLAGGGCGAIAASD